MSKSIQMIAKTEMYAYILMFNVFLILIKNVDDDIFWYFWPPPQKKKKIVQRSPDRGPDQSDLGTEDSQFAAFFSEDGGGGDLSMESLKILMEDLEFQKLAHSWYAVPKTKCPKINLNCWNCRQLDFFLR
jgi:hypothetical protein